MTTTNTTATPATIKPGKLVGNSTSKVSDQRFNWNTLTPELAERQGYDLTGGQTLIENCHTGYRLIVEIEGRQAKLARRLDAPMMARLLAYEIETYATPEGVIRGRPTTLRGEAMWTRVDNLAKQCDDADCSHLVETHHTFCAPCGARRFAR